MIRINPDPHTGGYVYVPTKAVTAFFPAGANTESVISELTKAGFTEERIQFFSGEQGADQLDSMGRCHGLWVRFMRSLEEVFADDADVFHRADQTLRAGGSVLAAFTHGKPEERRQAAAIMKAHGGRDVIYWGRWLTEYL